MVSTVGTYDASRRLSVLNTRSILGVVLGATPETKGGPWLVAIERYPKASSKDESGWTAPTYSSNLLVSFGDST
jgi:hypothetical protein